jgi:hypothetical protein
MRSDIIGGMTSAMVAEPRCSACGAAATRIELVAPGQPPAQWNEWSQQHRETYERYRDPAQWYLLVRGVVAHNGWVGSPIDAGRAQDIAAAFRSPYSYAQVHTAGFYDDAGFCEQCAAAFCSRHWNVSASGYGHCPQGHGKSLDPHWSP